ncbi:MAG: 1-acyl-sn-glycerol-3-phosphate acyltransferase, partial [Planctomycetes bacterium]|nr:1-acyl-sn-glycerol-3-phosphate acyltransferase [Planctomycetota bacterium]
MDRQTLTSLAVLLVLAAALGAWIIHRWRQTRFTFFQATLCLSNTFVARILWRAQVSGPLPVTEGEGIVIVCNHRSGVDPMMIQLCTDRVVHWMVAREYYKMPLASYAFRSVNAIPVNRGGIDTAATKMAIRLAREGGVVGLFPEGRVNTSDELLLPGRPGAALIALKARVKVIPCFVRGSPYDGTAMGSFFMAGNARVTVGEPIDLSSYFGRNGDKAVLQELTKLFLVEIARLGGVDDFEPKLAGRNWKASQEQNEVDGNGAPA